MEGLTKREEILAESELKKQEHLLAAEAAIKNIAEKYKKIPMPVFRGNQKRKARKAERWELDRLMNIMFDEDQVWCDYKFFCRFFERKAAEEIATLGL